MATLRELVTKIGFDIDDAKLDRFDKKISNFKRKLKSFSNTANSAGRALSLRLTLPISALGITSVNATRELEGLEASLGIVLNKFVEGSATTKDVREEIDFLRKTTDELGVSFISSSRPFAKFLASSKFTREETRKVFTSFAKLGRVFNLSGDDFGGIIRALEQMQSKGTVMAEELRLQLGDRIPGVVNLFARAMGKSNKEFLKAMEQGEVSADILKDVAVEIENTFGGKSFEKASKSLNAQLSRLGNSFFFFRREVGLGIVQALELNKNFSSLSDVLRDLAKEFSNLDDKGKKILIFGAGFLALLAPVLLILGQLTIVLTGIITLVSAFIAATSIAFLALSAAFVVALTKSERLREAIGFLFKEFFIASKKVFGVIVNLFINPFQALLDVINLVRDALSSVVSLGKSALSGAGNIIGKGVDTAKNFLGFDDNNVPQAESIVRRVQQNINVGNTPRGSTTNTNNKRTLNFNFSPDTSARDQTSIEEGVRRMLDMENRNLQTEALAVE